VCAPSFAKRRLGSGLFRHHTERAALREISEQQFRLYGLGGDHDRHGVRPAAWHFSDRHGRFCRRRRRVAARWALYRAG
jgi:hypothetical protein